MSTFRSDTATLAPLPKTAAGYLRVPPSKITRTGVFSYVQPDGTTRRELRHPDHVFAAESLDSLRMIPVTHKHPGDLDATKAREFARGAVGDTITHDADSVLAPVGIFDADLIKAIEAGESELSCGYHCDFDPTPGEWNGQAYDGLQTAIRYNHLAVVSRGRAGHTVALKLDSAPEVKPMALIKVAGKDVECTQEIADAFTAMSKEVDSAKAAQAATAGERDVLAARADAAPAVDVRALVKARTALEREAEKHISSERFDSMSDVELQMEVVKTVLPALDLKDKAEAYVLAAYDAAIASRPSKAVAGLAAIKGAQTTRADAGISAHEQMIQRQANAWKVKK